MVYNYLCNRECADGDRSPVLADSLGVALLNTFLTNGTICFVGV